MTYPQAEKFKQENSDRHGKNNISMACVYAIKIFS